MIKICLVVVYVGQQRKQINILHDELLFLINWEEEPSAGRKI